MPPQRAWFTGQNAVVGFLAARVLRPGRWRVPPTPVNGRPAVIVDEHVGGGRHEAHGVQILPLVGPRISRITAFNNPDLVPVFRDTAVRTSCPCACHRTPDTARAAGAKGVPDRARQKLVFRADREAVTTPLIDCAMSRPETDGDRVALFGHSLGGCLVARAAAFEHRVAGSAPYGECGRDHVASRAARQQQTEQDPCLPRVEHPAVDQTPGQQIGLRARGTVGVAQDGTAAGP